MAFHFVHGKHSVGQLAEAFGLGGKPIIGIEIKARVNDITRVTIEFCAQNDEIGGACTFFKEYKLVPSEPEFVPECSAPQTWRDKPPLA